MRRGTADTAVYIAGSLAYKLVAFLAVPVLARALEPAELGLLDLSVVMAGMIAITAGAGMDHAVARYEREFPPGSLWLTTIVALAVTGAIVLVLALAAAPTASSWILGGSGNAALFGLAACYGLAMAMLTTAMNAVRLRANARRYAILAFCILALEIGIAIAMALGGLSVQAILAAWTALSVLGALIIGILHLPHLSTLNGHLFRQLLAFGLPLVPAAVAWHVGELVVRASIASSGDLPGLGAYGVAHRITSTLAIAVTSFTLAWQPLVYRAEPRQQPVIAARGVSIVIAVVALGALAVSSVAPELVTLIGGSGYARGAGVVPLLGLAAVFSGGFAMLTVVAGVAMRTPWVAAVAFAGVGAQLVGAVVLVPIGGLGGAAIASLAGYALSAILLLALLRWTGSGPAPVRTLGTVGIACVSLLILAVLGAGSPLVTRLAISAISGLLIGALALGEGRELMSAWRDRYRGPGHRNDLPHL